MLELDRIRGIEQGKEGPIFSRPVMNEARFTYFVWDVPVVAFVDLRDAFCFWVIVLLRQATTNPPNREISALRKNRRSDPSARELHPRFTLKTGIEPSSHRHRLRDSCAYGHRREAAYSANRQWRSRTRAGMESRSIALSRSDLYGAWYITPFQ